MIRQLLSRIPLRESRVLVIACGLLFLGFLTAYLVVEPPIKQKRRMERLLAEKNVVAPEAYVPVWLYKGLKINLALAGALFLASPWLGKRRTPTMKFLPEPVRPSWTKWHTLGLVGAVGLTAWINAPRLTLSMWGDEDFNAAKFILDKVERKPDGTLEIQPRSWDTTLWNMRKPTNHLGYSFFARLTHEAFFKPGDAPSAPWFSEALLRAPVYVGGLLTIALVLWSLHVWGLSGWWTVLLLAIHPWFIRFAVDGRGYGFVMLGATALMGITGRALQTGRWRWWLLMGAVEFFILWSNFQSIYLLAALNVMVLAALLKPGMTWESRLLLGRRSIVGGLVTSLLVFGWLTPCYPQMKEFLLKKEIQGTMDLRWWQDSFSGWVFGQPWNAWHRGENSLHHCLSEAFQQHPVLHLAAMSLLIIVVIAGIGALLTDSRRWPLAIFIVAAPCFMLLHMKASGDRPYPWYLVPFLPSLLCLVAATAAMLAKWSPKLSWAVCGLTLALFAAITQVPRETMRHHPIEPSRESVASYREIMSPRHPDFDKKVMGGALSMFTAAYDPAMYRVANMEEFQTLLAEADKTGRQLYMNLGDIGFLKSFPAYAPIIQVLEDPEKFEHTKHFPGLMPFTSRDVFRYRGKNP